ncbi:MAG: dTDP-glucose 4,6-dehydratase [Candidatus Omnitrophica bacterium]|nr:dTDP-glucose 4,6-dehydratase [Candidatus Omnitrophota bacterium]
MRKKIYKILVTGGAGFIGSEFVRQAVKQGHQMVVVDKLTYAGDLARLKSVQGKFVFYKTDIADLQKVMIILKKERPRAIVHFAAESHVDRSILDASEFVYTNIGGTQQLLTASREMGIKRFIHVSTDEVYGEISRGKFKEHFPLNPNSPYSASKASADFLVKAYIHTFGFPAIIVRPSNNYGPWQFPEKFIPVIIYKAIKNQKIPVYAKGLNVREWLHISDCARAVLATLELGQEGEIYNIGSALECKNITLVKMILKILARSQHLITFVKDRPGHDFRYALDSHKIQNNLFWKPHVDFEEGIFQTVQWYQENFTWLERKVKFLENYWKQIYKPTHEGER